MSLEGKIKLLGRTTRENADLLDQCADTPDAGLAVIMGHVIHDFYNSVEDIFESIAGTFGEMPEKTDAWHKDLLASMGAESPNYHPAIISDDLMTTLDEYRNFRHVYRNRPAHALILYLTRPLMEKIPDTYFQVKEEITDFIRFLKAAAFEQQEMTGIQEDHGSDG